MFANNTHPQKNEKNFYVNVFYRQFTYDSHYFAHDVNFVKLL